MKVIVVVFCLAIVGCSIDSIAKQQLIANIKQSHVQVQETENFYIVEKATPSMILMLDSFIAQHPRDLDLLLKGSQTHFSYAALFIDHEDNPEWASMHYKQARAYALQACKIEPEILNDLEKFNSTLASLGSENIEAVFLLAMSWGSWIAINADNIEFLDQLPQVEALMKKVIAWDNNYQDGLPFMFLGKLNSKSEVANNYFEKALTISQRQLLLIHVEYAKTLARFSVNKSLFESLLTEVVDTWESRKQKKLKQNFTLVNSVSYNTAKNLLDDVEEFYEEDEDEDEGEDE